MAIPMPIVQDIRRLDRQGMSRAQIARRLHVDRGTVAKYADMEDCSPKPKADRRYGSKIDPYAHLVDEWLEADRMLPRKQRHTIRRVHDRLLAETDYDGEYSTTMRYVHRWREANRGVPDREGYVRLEWAAGSMQVDFGVARARIAGEMADVHCLVVSLPYSNMRLCVALPGENAECLCHGLMLVFEHIGGVPPVIVMDNATGAGRRNAKGEVALTGVFSAFVAHYRLEVRFCNPYSGNEKGSVENAVGFLRRNLMVPPMRAESYGQLSRLLLERCDGLARDSCLCSISCCGFSHDDFSGLGRACRPRNGLNWMVLVSPPERTGKDYDQHAPSTVYPSFAAERGIRRVDRAENTCQRADGA